MNSYWNKDGLLRAKDFEDDQNLLLRTSYYHLLKPEPEVKANLHRAATLMFDDGHIAQHPYTTWQEDPASHDELTAFLYVTAKDPDLIKKIKVGPYIKYPQVLFHLLYCKTRSAIYLWISCLWMLGGIWRKTKSSNGRWDTDSELLSMTKIETIRQIEGSAECDIPFYRTMLKRLRKNWGEDYPRALINEMLWYDNNHPLRLVFDSNKSL